MGGLRIFSLLALRNLRRQSRRTAVSLAMIISGFCAVVLFNGFFADVLAAMEIGAVDAMYGHLQVAKPD